MPRRRMVSESLAQWDKEGLTISGVYVEKGSFQQMRDGKAVDVPKYTLKNEVATIVVNGTLDINAAMENVQIGETVEIVYKGEVVTAAGYRVKKFEVYVHDSDEEVDA